MNALGKIAFGAGVGVVGYAAFALPCFLDALATGRLVGERADLRYAAEGLKAYREEHGIFPNEVGEAHEYLSYWTTDSRFGDPRVYITDGQRFVLASPGKNGRFERLPTFDGLPLEGELAPRDCEPDQDDQVITHLGWWWVCGRGGHG